MSRWKGYAPPLLSILESGRGKAEATTYQLLLPASHRPTDRLDLHPGDRPTDRPTDRLDFHPEHRPTYRPTDRLDSYHRDRLDSSGSTLIALSLSPAPSKSDDPEHLEAQRLLSDYHQQELRSACSLADLMAAAYHLDRDGLTSSAQRIIDTLSEAIAQAENAKKSKRTAAITALRGLVSQ